MQKSFRRSVRWDRQAASYQFCEQVGNTIRTSDLDFQSHIWQEWLEQVSSFTFQGKDGHHFTARKETRARGDVYWIAYRKVSGKLTHKYLGRPVDVTPARLEQVAATLAGQEIQATISEPTDGHRESSMQELLADQLLATKFFVPSSLRALVSRPRLSTLLDEGLLRSLTVVSAPAGFGKTTLLSAWIQTLPKETTRVAWVSLDEQDNDLVRFWMYVFTALDRLQPAICSELMAYLRTQQAPPIQYLLTALINRLAEHPQRWLLVLDDVHLLTEPAIYTSLTYLVEHVSPQLRIILASRSDPPLPLARLRACGQLLEVRADQLRATNDEAAVFLREVMGVHLSDQELVVVQQRTENWLAGLQLVGLSLQGSSTPTRDLLSEVSGNQDYILDYLTDEILNRQPLAIQTFLLYTSILEHLSAPLCDAVLEQQGSQHVLEELERSNLFLTPLDGRHHWYRYHALFAQALRYQLEQWEGEQVAALHLRASRWYAGQGYLNEAIHHALLAQAWQWAADLIESSAGPGTSLFSRGKSWTIRHWLQQLPEETIRARPRLCLAYARSLRLAAHLRAAEPWLQAAEAALLASAAPPSSRVDPLSGTQWSAFKSFVGYPTQVPESTENDSTVFHKEHERDRMLGEILALRALIAGNYGESRAALDLCQQAMTHLSEQDHYEHALVSFARGLAFNAVGQAKAATQSALESSASYQAAGMIGSAISYMGVATVPLHMQGQLHAVWRICQRAIQLGTEAGSSANAAVGLIYARQADILREWNQLDVALDLALEGFQLSRPPGYELHFPHVGIVLVRIHLARGDIEAATEALQQVAQAPRVVDSSFTRAWLISVEQARLWLAVGDLERATRWAQELEQRERPLSSFAQERQDVARTRILLAQAGRVPIYRARATEALDVLASLLINAQTAERWDHVIEILLLQALAYQMCHEMHKALTVLAHAVSIAQPEGYIRRFLDEGPPMAALLSNLREHERKKGPTPYLDRVLAAFAQEGGTVQATPATLLPDRISPREREVLHLLAQGRSNQEIADALVVTVETVKRHVSSLLAKLGVDNRTQAALRARSLGLLSDEP